MRLLLLLPRRDDRAEEGLGIYRAVLILSVANDDGTRSDRVRLADAGRLRTERCTEMDSIMEVGFFCSSVVARGG